MGKDRGERRGVIKKRVLDKAGKAKDLERYVVAINSENKG